MNVYILVFYLLSMRYLYHRHLSDTQIYYKVDDYDDRLKEIIR